MPLHLIATVGRVILGAYFLLGGLGKIFGVSDNGAIAQMTAHGIPMAEYLFPLSGACEIIGGLTLFVGLHTRFADAGRKAGYDLSSRNKIIVRNLP